MSSSLIVVTGGGTGGHVFPALAISKELRKRGFEIFYIGSDRGMEAKLAPLHDIPFRAIRSGAIKNQNPIQIARSLLRVAWATLWSLSFLFRKKPAAVIGVGGYVSVPVCCAAYVMGIPIFIQEQNTSVGIANRFLGKLAKRIFLGFEQAKYFFPLERTLITGNPLREEIGNHPFPTIDANHPNLLILGGSQGAHAINRAVLTSLPTLRKNFPKLEILHQTGTRDLDEARKAYEPHYPNAKIVPFIEDMAGAYRDATLVVSRSGALTVSELIWVGRPAVLVPYPRRGQNDQTDNAKYLANSGAAVIVEEGVDFGDRFRKALCSALDSHLSEMASSYSKLRTPGALVSIAARIEQDLSNRKNT